MRGGGCTSEKSTKKRIQGIVPLKGTVHKNRKCYKNTLPNLFSKTDFKELILFIKIRKMLRSQFFYNFFNWRSPFILNTQ